MRGTQDNKTIMAKIKLTPARIAETTCPTEKSQIILRDTEQPGLGLRITKGSKSYIFQCKLLSQVIRMTIGDIRTWRLGDARKEARRLKTIADEGRDPRQVKAEKMAADLEKQAQQRIKKVTVQDVWDLYIAERKPHWGELHYRDHLELTQKGGDAYKRVTGTRKKKTGLLVGFMPLPLGDITPELLQTWAEKESLTRPGRVRLALNLFKVFLNWCSNEPAYREMVNPLAGKSRKLREIVGHAKPRNDYLQREQLAAWFTHVQAISNRVLNAYLQCLLLTGARKEEVATLKWEDIDFQWKGISMRDKIHGRRDVPLTPYVEALLMKLPRRNEWVFSSPRSKSGRIEDPTRAHTCACMDAGLGGLTLHGLRRSFASLCEWMEIPGGISAQIQGHAPQGVREQRYIRRPLDLLRKHHCRIEEWILTEAGLNTAFQEVKGE